MAFEIDVQKNQYMMAITARIGYNRDTFTHGDINFNIKSQSGYPGTLVTGTNDN